MTGREPGDVSPPYTDLSPTSDEDGVTISVQQVPDKESLGMHIDIVVDDIDEAILQDPDGNRFCLVTN